MEFITKNDYIYLNLKNDILSGAIEQGSRLVVNTIATNYGVSTIPVREAINRLAQEGLIVSVPHVGAHVKQFVFDEMIDTLIMLFPLCKLALQLSAENVKPKQIEEMRDKMKQIKSHVEDEGTRVFYDDHSRFHLMCFSAHSNKVLINALSENLPKIQQIFNSPHYSEQEWMNACKEHEELISALENHDSYKAITILRMHYHTAAMRFLNYVKKILEEPNGKRYVYYLNSLSGSNLGDRPGAFLDFYRQKIDFLLTI